MDELEKDVKEYYMLRDYPHKTKWSGSGRIVINRHIINYREGQNTNGCFDVYFWAGKNKRLRPCFVLKITEEKDAILQSVDRRQGCFVDNHDNSKDLVRAAIQLSKNKNAKSFQFMDNSFIQCPEKVHLADLSFLTTGKTWYESFLSIIPIDPDEKRKIEKYRNIVTKNNWVGVLENMKKLDEPIDLDIDGIDIYSEGSAMLVLDRAKKTKLHCKTFNKKIKSLLLSSGIPSLQGIVWLLQSK